MSRSASTRTRVGPPDGNLRAVPCDVAIGDWEVLLSAVKSRLRSTVGELLAVLPEHQLPDAAQRVQASVLECVSALDQLHLTLSHELARRYELEREVIEAQTALARACEQLGATRGDEQHVGHPALHDGLTALPNRTSFDEQLTRALADPERRRQGLALLLLDLDGFKAFNEQRGREAGDQMLRIVAARLARSLRADDRVSRVGGDEFACLLAQVPSREQLSRLACKIYYAIGAPMKIEQVSITIRASIGISVCPAEGASAETLLKGAVDAIVRARAQNTRYAFSTEGVEADGRVCAGTGVFRQANARSSGREACGAAPPCLQHSHAGCGACENHMEKNDLPEAFGVFKPVGHIVMAFRSATDQQAAAQTLLRQGFAASALVRFTPEEMKTQVDADVKSASVLASLGQELNLVKAHRALAESGCSFLVVHAPDDELAERVAVVARTMKAVAAQRYGRFIIEELLGPGPGEGQVFESPERGLDVETPTAPPR